MRLRLGWPGALTLGPVALLGLAAVLAAAAEYLVTLRPRLVDLPAGLDGALRPIWPDPAAVLAAMACFALAACAFAAAARPGAPDAACWVSVRVAGTWCRPLSRFAIGLLVAGLLGWVWVVVRLLVAPTDAAVAGVLCLALVAVLAALAHLEGRGRRPTWHADGTAVLEVVSVACLLGLFTFLMTFDLGSWYYSAIGDEHAFYLMARELVVGLGQRSLFAQDGAYGIIPVMSGFLEAAQMHVFGVTGVGWKLATITPVILALVATYALARSLFNRRVALLTLGVLATSHYLLAYGHTGYPNLEPLLPGVLAPLLFVAGIRRSSVVVLVAAGLVAGFGWYTYYTSRTTVVILTAATLLMVQPRSWAAAAAPLGVGFTLMVVPLFAVSKLDVLNKMLDQTGSGTTTEAAADRALLPLWNAGRSLLAFNYNTHAGSWLSGSLLDPLAGALFVFGLVWVCSSWRDVRSRLLLAWFAIGLVFTGIVSKYDYVSVSRLNFLVPLVCLFSGIAAERVVAILEQHAPRELSRYVFPGVLVGCVAIAGWGNLQRWFVDTPAAVPTSPTSVTMRIIEDQRCLNAVQPPVLVDAGIGGALLPALQAAGLQVRPDFGLYADTPDWIETAASRCVIFRAPHDPESLNLQEVLASRWPDSVAVHECDRSGLVEVLAYYPRAGDMPDQAWLGCRSRPS